MTKNENPPKAILKQFGLDIEHAQVQQLTSGLINKTWKISISDRSYILQKINDHVFKNPNVIDQNLNHLKTYLNLHHPDYLFVAPLPTTDGQTLINSEDGYYRLFDFVKDSNTLKFVNTAEEAFEAARQFGKFTRLLSNFNTDDLAYTIPDFHNLNLRYSQFIDACSNASPERHGLAKEAIQFITENKSIADTYNQIIANRSIPRRVIHHDTKISNVLFDQHQKGICIIDLDTVMPGFYFSDVGDMMRTYLSAANEEETDFTLIKIRKDFFRSIFLGYLSEMNPVLNDDERQLFIYSGEFSIYMQAIRFLTDFLNNDVYYEAKYPGHNLNRAMNQITLLKEYVKARPDFKIMMSDVNLD